MRVAIFTNRSENLLRKLLVPALTVFTATLGIAQTAPKKKPARIVNTRPTRPNTKVPSKVTGDGVKTESGLQYWDLKVGTGEVAKEGDRVPAGKSIFSARTGGVRGRIIPRLHPEDSEIVDSENYRASIHWCIQLFSIRVESDRVAAGSPDAIGQGRCDVRGQRLRPRRNRFVSHETPSLLDERPDGLAAELCETSSDHPCTRCAAERVLYQRSREQEVVLLWS